MFMSKITLDAVNMKRAGVYEEHQALWKVFSDHPDRERDFLYRKTDDGYFLTVSSREPLETGLLKRVECKEYNPTLKAGERIFFSLRFNPIVKRRDEKNRQVRVDMVQDMRKKMIDEGVPASELPRRLEIAEEVAGHWFDRRSDFLGVEVEKSNNNKSRSIIVESYTQDKFRKSGGKNVVLSRIDLQGFAIVNEPEKFRQALFNGVGCAKGFGFGLLLVRRA